MPIIHLPQQLKAQTDSPEKIEFPGDVLHEVLSNLMAFYPQLRPYLLDDSDNICSFVSLYLNGKDVRFLDNQNTPVSKKDILMIIPAIAGG
jgi:molybdopterin synthase sulfur carrier subunit